MTEFLKDGFSGILGELAAVSAAIDATAAEKLLNSLLAAPAVFTAAAGRSGLLLRCAAMRLMHMGRTTYVVGEVVTPAIHGGDLLLILSGSGETGSLVAMAKKGKALGANLAVVTANPLSTLSGLADLTLHIPAPTPKAAVSDFVPSGQPMGSLFEESAFLLFEAIIMEMMRRSGKTSDLMFERHANLE